MNSHSTLDIRGKNYHIYMDNFFSSVSLYKNLLLDNIYCTGTLPVNRRNFSSVHKKVVKSLPKKVIKKMMLRVNIYLIMWQDIKPVTCILSCHHPVCTWVVQRKEG